LPGVRRFEFPQAHRVGDLRGRVALLTGGRVKIGYSGGIKLLRAGCNSSSATRFPRDAATRYAAEPDFAEWGIGWKFLDSDLRPHASVEAFCRICSRRGRGWIHHQQRVPDGAASAGFLSAT